MKRVLVFLLLFLNLNLHAVEKGYIPCCILKSVSYGQMGVTNSKAVYDIFEGKIVYNEDTYQLFYDAQEKIRTTSKEEMGELMDFVRDNHTYLNRIEVLLDCLALSKESK